ETLALLCTYAKGDAFPAACARLAGRLEAAGESWAAALTHMLAGNLAACVGLWQPDAVTDAGLVRVVEKAAVLRASIDPAAPLPPPPASGRPTPRRPGFRPARGASFPPPPFRRRGAPRAPPPPHPPPAPPLRPRVSPPRPPRERAPVSPAPPSPFPPAPKLLA